MNGRTGNLPYNVIVINQNASRVWREDFVVAMAKVIPDFFKEDSKNGRKIIVRSDHLCQEREESFLAEKCSQYDLPYFEIPQSQFEWFFVS